MSATIDGTMIAAAAPATACPAIAHHTVGARIIITEEAANSAITIRKMSTQPIL